VCKRKRGDQESVETEEETPGECGTGRGKTRRVWNRKREVQESVKLEERKQGKCGTEHYSTGGFAKNNQNQIWDGDLGVGNKRIIKNIIFNNVFTIIIYQNHILFTCVFFFISSNLSFLNTCTCT
jgi:hypothetical protein